MEQTLCQSCRQAPVEALIDSSEPPILFRVCHACEKRLEAFALRPLEWFNLASIHGPHHYLIHDDFYDEDGVAHGPEIEITEAESFPAPAIEAVSSDLERLLDYARTKWRLRDDVIAALKLYQKEAVLAALQDRIGATGGLRVKDFAYEICARVLGRTAEDWVRNEWAFYREELFVSLAEASAACLPMEEGFRLVVNALGDMDSKDQKWSKWVLAHFRSEATLDWIEQNIRDPLMEDWGGLAASSQLSWGRAAKWITSGRPLSLVALDALNACWHYDTPLLQRHTPKLLAPAEISEMNAALQHYLEQDQVPRVRKAITSIVEHWSEICATPQ